MSALTSYPPYISTCAQKNNNKRRFLFQFSELFHKLLLYGNINIIFQIMKLSVLNKAVYITLGKKQNYATVWQFKKINSEERQFRRCPLKQAHCSIFKKSGRQSHNHLLIFSLDFWNNRCVLAWGFKRQLSIAGCACFWIHVLGQWQWPQVV